MELEAEAQSMQWPEGRPPTGIALARYSKAIAVSSQSAQTQVGWANICAWYSEWRRDFADGRSIEPGVLSYVQEQIPQLRFVLGDFGASDILRNLGQKAAAGDAGAVDEYLELIKCASLAEV
jgi:hypothetical protein